MLSDMLKTFWATSLSALFVTNVVTNLLAVLLAMYSYIQQIVVNRVPSSFFGSSVVNFLANFIDDCIVTF